MANGVGKHKLLVVGPTEPWSVREKLCLATSVMKSGDQNWVSVSRAIKPFAEPGRPPDWFSQKHCASKYSELLETTEAPKRKRGEKGEVVETVEDVIVRRLTAERIEQLKRLIKETQDKHRKLKREAELIQAGHLDSKLEELWEEILQKKKQEEEEAELKRKNTDAAYQARQVAKNPPKRMPSVTMHSPSSYSSPGQDFSPGDPLECLTLDLASSKNASVSARLMTFAETSGPSTDDIPPGAPLDDPTQKKLLGQKATPPPSPLLSELLKKGSILATNARLIGDGDGSTSNFTGVHDLHLAPACQPLSQATGAPMLSRLLEAGPAHFSPPLGFMISADSGAPLSAATPVSADSTNTAKTEVLSAPLGCQVISTEEKVSAVSEEDVTVSYMGDELDLKTVGDIIAIIEEKADEAAEALDAAAVEAALSLCEENGHTLPGGWNTGPFQPQESDPSVASQSSALHHGLQGGAEASLSSLYSSQNNNLSVFPMEQRNLPPTPSSSWNSNSLEHCHSPTNPLSQAMKEAGQPGDRKKHISIESTIKCEHDTKAQQRPEKTSRDSVLEDIPQTERELEETKVEDGSSVEGGENALESKAYSEVTGPDVCGEEDGDGAEEFSSEPEGEMELEPAASESEDGYSLHTASSSLQLHTTADSIPSSPASSPFSVCSEDLEALQAQKIWKKAIMLVWRAAANHRYANVFLQPVTDEIAPGYHSIVHRPMDLATIKKNIETGLIRTTAEFQRDIMLMFQNAVMYNSLDHDVYHMALEMQRDVLEQIQQFLATQLIMETCESGISAKSLRGRDSTRKQDSADKDTVSMSSPAFLLSLFDSGTRGRRSAIEADLKMKK